MDADGPLTWYHSLQLALSMPHTSIPFSFYLLFAYCRALAAHAQKNVRCCHTRVEVSAPSSLLYTHGLELCINVIKVQIVTSPRQTLQRALSYASLFNLHVYSGTSISYGTCRTNWCYRCIPFSFARAAKRLEGCRHTRCDDRQSGMFAERKHRVDGRSTGVSWTGTLL